MVSTVKENSIINHSLITRTKQNKKNHHNQQQNPNNKPTNPHLYLQCCFSECKLNSNLWIVLGILSVKYYFQSSYMLTTFFSVILLANIMHLETLNSSASESEQGFLYQLQKLFSPYIFATASSEVSNTTEHSTKLEFYTRASLSHSSTSYYELAFYYQFSMPRCVLPKTTVWRFTRHCTHF